MKNRHEMIVEGRGSKGGKRKAVKKSVKHSTGSRKFARLKRQAWDVLGGVGFVTMIMILFWLVVGGGPW